MPAGLAWWVGDTAADEYTGLETTLLYHARLENPNPERDLTAIDLEISDYFRSAISIFAITLEPAVVEVPAASGGSEIQRP